MSYEAWQLLKIRDGLQVFRKLGLRDSGSEYSWRSLAEAIQELTGVQIPEERLRKFVMGEPYRNPDRELNDRYYPSLTPERLEAVIAFLTQDGDDNVFSREDLKIKPARLSAILTLVEYLNDNRHSERMSDAYCLSGYFVADQSPTDISITTTLRFRNTTHQGLVPFVLLKEYVDGIRTSELSKHKPEQLKKTSHTLDRYEGWGVMTPEETIILLAKNCKTDENLLYITLGIDKALYLSQPANALVLLEIEQPEDTIIVDFDQDKNNAKALFANVKEAFSQQLILFERKSI